MNHNGRVAVVTGAAQGIGRRTAEVLAERGFRIAIIDVQEAGATIAAVEARDAEAMSFAADITSEDRVEEFAGPRLRALWARRSTRQQPHLY